MKTLTTASLMIASLALSACSGGLFNNDRLGTGGEAPLDPSASDIATTSFPPNSVEYFNQTIGDRVLFAVDTSTLTDTGRLTLDQQAGWLVNNPSYTGIIEGHADEQGTREYNLALGARRAAAVRDYLVSRGVADARLRRG